MQLFGDALEGTKLEQDEQIDQQKQHDGQPENSGIEGALQGDVLAHVFEQQGIAVALDPDVVVTIVAKDDHFAYGVAGTFDDFGVFGDGDDLLGMGDRDEVQLLELFEEALWILDGAKLPDKRLGDKIEALFELIFGGGFDIFEPEHIRSPHTCKGE